MTCTSATLLTGNSTAFCRCVVPFGVAGPSQWSNMHKSSTMTLLASMLTMEISLLRFKKGNEATELGLCSELYLDPGGFSALVWTMLNPKGYTDAKVPDRTPAVTSSLQQGELLLLMLTPILLAVLAAVQCLILLLLTALWAALLLFWSIFWLFVSSHRHECRPITFMLLTYFRGY